MLAVSISFALGCFGWTLLEYVLHNYAGHVPKGRHRISREHLDHHKNPSYFTSAPKKLLLAVPVLSTVALLASLLADPARGLSFTIGLGVGWTFYEYLHRSLHVRAPRTAYGRWARRHHFAHHFNSPRMNHGVTTPLWDIVLGTHEPPEIVRVPRRHAPKLPWLLEGDEEGLAIASSFVRDYELTGRSVTVAAPQPPR